MTFLIWLQGFEHPILDIFFTGITLMGESLFYIVVLSGVYWCVDKRFAKQLVAMLLFSTVLNGSMKEIFNTARPVGVEGVRSLRVHTAEGASFPSGHTQTASVFFLGLSTLMKKNWLWACSAVIITLVALSRLYLGVHWPIDVVFGIAFGALSVGAGIYLYKLSGDKKQWPYVTGGLLCITLVSLFFFDSTNYLKAIGPFWGFWIGDYLEKRFIDFDHATRFSLKLKRYALGMTTTLCIYIGLKLIFPSTAYFDGLRYFATVFHVVFVTPWLFMILNWAKREV